MDDLTQAFYEAKFETAFLKKKANEFQDFFSEIMEKSHPADFTRTRPWGNVGDRKNDGYLKSERTLFQVYAPNEMSARETVAKIEEDFKEALPHWKKYFDRWVFAHNSRIGIGPHVLDKLLELDHDHDVEVIHWGFEELRLKVIELEPDTLASLLGPAPTRRHMLDLGLESLSPVLDQIAATTASTEPDLRPPPADKIRRNFLSDHVATLLKAGMARADLVRRYFQVQPAKRDEIAESFRTHYQTVRQRGLAPDQVFEELQRLAGGEAVPSPARQSAVLAVLAFFFEECDIFEREDVQGVPK